MEIKELTSDDINVVHATLLKLLRDFIFVCEKNNLMYFMGGGSALGTIRHNGFIPWDDDLDINMPRKDYDIFIEIFNKELGDLYDMSVPNSDCVEHSYMKIYKKGTVFAELLPNKKFKGLWIDIFPIENASNNFLFRIVEGVCSDILHFVAVSLFLSENRTLELEESYRKSGRIMRYKLAVILGDILPFVSSKNICNLFDNFVKKHRTTDYYTVPNGRAHYYGEILTTDMIFPPRKKSFEGIQINVYNKVEEYLTALYGDYMKIPPPDRREKHYVSEFKIDDNVQWKITNNKL